MIDPENKFFLYPDKNVIVFIGNYYIDVDRYKALILTKRPYSDWITTKEINRLIPIDITDVQIKYTQNKQISDLKVGDRFKFNLSDIDILVVISIQEALITYMTIDEKAKIKANTIYKTYTMLQSSNRVIHIL